MKISYFITSKTGHLTVHHCPLQIVTQRYYPNVTGCNIMGQICTKVNKKKLTENAKRVKTAQRHPPKKIKDQEFTSFN